MMRARPILAIFLCGATALPSFGETPEISSSLDDGVISRLTHNYRPGPIRPISFADSTRIESLMRAGSIYLSLRDAIALALENNLDIENSRFGLLLADANMLRASAGTLLRNVSNNVSSGPSSASGGVLASNQLGSGANSTGGSGQGGVLSGLNVQLAGSSIPNLDPQAFFVSQYTHQTIFETATNIAGTSTLTNQQKTANYGIQQQFLTGTTVSLGMSNTLGQNQNSPFNNYNPFSQASLQLSFQQNLLQGFRPSVNNRAIRVAKNQRQISDLTFKNQVMATVANVVGLYWDLVSFNDILKVRQQTLDLNTKLYHDNQRRAELGAIAPIDIIQAEAEMKSSQQDVTNAETQVLEQEAILKSALTRSGLDSLDVINARIVPLDHFTIPPQEQVRPIQDLISEAIASRPDLEQSRIGLEDARINMKGTRDAMLPQLAVFGSTSNSGLAGQVNPLPFPVQLPSGATQLVARSPGQVDQFFLGGYGNILSQIFSRKFPNYSVGVQLSVPIRNRSAQADFVTDQLNYRQSQIQDKQLQNSIKVNVVRARTDLSQARAAYDSSVEARQLQEQTYAGTRRKYELGTATIIDLLTTQRDNTTRELNEASALNQYIHAKVNLENVLGEVLQDYDVGIDEALKGTVSRPPDPVPAVTKP
ncbi:MAG TPA: TolC family protein [Bryobacteraceae bacterium]|jgi:outer membrane protein TolC|nr:TolC family protein [Bryobacteraceae bacterium]